MNTNEYYTDIDECKQHFKNRVNTNSRYKNFYQTIFTAGDEEQFHLNRKTNAKNAKSKSTKNKNSICVDNTFLYLFHKFKKGIFVKIQNNELSMFLPFSKHHYINQWSKEQISSIDMTYFYNLCKSISSYDEYKFNPKSIQSNPSLWVSNGALVRYEFPVFEGDSGVCALKHLFQELCKTKKIPNVEFFINKRDFPVLRKDRKETNEYFFPDTQLLSHSYEEYAPILSMCSSKDHDDIPIPTWEDFGRIMSFEKKYYPKMTTDFNIPDIPWKNRKNIAVFRGSSTGYGLDEKTNMRIYVSLLSLTYNDILDAGITKWNLRPRKMKEKGNKITFQTFSKDIIEKLPLKSYMTLKEQCSYKYIINIDGHVKAFRQSIELGTGSVSIIVESNYNLWYSNQLVPFTHYVPVKGDCSDLIEKIQWCIDNDKECKKIANNAKKFYDKILSKKGMMTYLSNLLKTFPSFTYHRHIFSNHLYNIEKEYVMEKTGKTENTENTNNTNNTDFWFSKTKTNVVHEAFVSSVLFSRKFKISDNEKTIYFPRIQGITFFDYLYKWNGIDEYLDIMIKIGEILVQYQQKYLFMHYDFYPWNIMIDKQNNPIIIDFEKSSIVYNYIYHYHSIPYNFKPFEFESIHDILCLLLSSLYTILNKHHLQTHELRKVFKLVSFMENTKFSNYTTFNSVKDLRCFLNNTKKYQEMLSRDKGELKSTNCKTIVDFMKEIRENHITGIIFSLKKDNYKLTENVLESKKEFDSAMEKYEELEELEKNETDTDKLLYYSNRETLKLIKKIIW